MAVQNEAKTKFAVMCSQMLPYFALPEFNRETWKTNLQFYHFISHLGLLAWNITLVKPSLAAAEKTLNQIRKDAFAGNTMIFHLLRIAAGWKWNYCRNEKVYFAIGEVTYDPETGKAGVTPYFEEEANGEGISFSEFRKELKSGDAGRKIAALMKERLNLEADLENFLQYWNRFGKQVFSSEQTQTLGETLFNVYMLIEEFQADKIIRAEKEIALLTAKMLFKWIPPNCCYETVKKRFPEFYRTKLFEFGECSSYSFVNDLKIAIGVELFYGHDSFLDDWNEIVESTLLYIPEQYRHMAENELRKTLEDLNLLSRKP